jgi:hypothetical protein
MQLLSAIVQAKTAWLTAILLLCKNSAQRPPSEQLLSCLIPLSVVLRQTNEVQDEELVLLRVIDQCGKEPIEFHERQLSRAHVAASRDHVISNAYSHKAAKCWIALNEVYLKAELLNDGEAAARGAVKLLDVSDDANQLRHCAELHLAQTLWQAGKVKVCLLISMRAAREPHAPASGRTKMLLSREPDVHVCVLASRLS